jgi:hypothetical protein
MVSSVNTLVRYICSAFAYCNSAARNFRLVSTGFVELADEVADVIGYFA